MTFQEVTMWMVVCDCCGEKAEYGDFSAWLDQDVAIERADGFDQVGSEHLCGACWCWPEDLPDYPGDDLWAFADDPVRAHAEHPSPDGSGSEADRG